jgi:putative glutamine amidotransferase
MWEKTVIGITKPDYEGNFAYAFIWLSVWLAGGKPLKITPQNAKDVIGVQGLILGGGKDVFPALFQDKPEPKKNYAYDHERDEMEIYWLRKAENEGLPVLGICRGAQLMNVAGGGKLHPDVSKAYEKANYPASWLSYIFYRKKIKIQSGSLLHKILGRTIVHVNSIHKQSIAEIAPGLIVTASEDNGVVQAIEKPDYDFYLGVQFHPEFLIYRRIFRELFKKLVVQAGRKRKD